MELAVAHTKKLVVCDDLSELTSNETFTIGLKEKARRVWRSYGILIVLIKFMDGYQIICLQSINKFCYDIAISRV